MAIVEIVYVMEDKNALHVTIPYAEAMTVAHVLTQSGLLQQYPNLMSLPVGIFARQVTYDTLVKPGDRIEIYRPLLASPMDRRRRRARDKL